MEKSDKINYYNLEINEALQELDSSEKGLTNEEAASRLEKYGLNKLDEGHKKTIPGIFASQFKDLMIWILIVAGIISGFLGEWIDASIILFVVILNAILGTIQESKAEAALEALKKMSAPFTFVIRKGINKKIPATEIVPGDIVILNAGDSLPADVRLIQSASLKIDESPLTGESVPEEKNIKAISGDVSLGDRENMAFMSTNITYGRGQGLVVATGMDTEMGKIAKGLSAPSKETTPLQQKLNQISNILSIGVVVIAIIIFIIGLISGRELLEVFLTSVSLAVAAIPEGLVAVITIVLAIGMSKLAKEGAIIRKLPAVETLGSTQIICSDKTGTLTQNKMTVKKIYSDNQELLYSAMLHCNDTDLGDQDELIGDPTETALIDYLLANQEINKAEIENRIRAGEIPFDSERKKSSVIIERGDGFYRVFVKGAVDGMLDSFTLSGEEKESLMVENEAMAAEALRVLAFGYKDIETYEGSVDLELEDQLIFLGLVGMIDPPREEVKEAIRVCREASIMPVMITGDHKITAVAIAEELGMLSDGRYAITGKELQEMSEVKFESEIDKIGVYARVAPEDKSRIVKMWQKKDKVVAMTGDGVNDAPALKTADIGVGMGITGTEVSKGASDMVLTDDNFATIVSAIREGRRIFDNIHKTISFLLSSNAGEVIAILLATILGWRLLSPIHILWINLVTDTFPALALGVEPAEGNLMAKKPRDSREPLFGKKQWVTVAFIGLIEGLLTLAAFLIGIKLFGDERVATTMAFVTLASTQLFASLGFQSSSESILRIKVKKHPALWLAFFGSLFIQLSVVLIPSLRELFKLAVLEPEAWFIIGFLSVLMLLSIEIKKLVTRIKSSKTDSILK